MTKIVKQAKPDANTIAYFEEYFSAANGSRSYGRMIVKDVPRRVKAALTAELITRSRKANKDNPDAPTPRLLSGSVAPLTHAVTDTSLILEGVFRGEVATVQGKSQRYARLFKATWDLESGALTGFRSVSAP